MSMEDADVAVHIVVEVTVAMFELLRSEFALVESCSALPILSEYFQ